MENEEYTPTSETKRKANLEIEIDNRGNASEDQVQAATIVARIVAKKLLTTSQLKKPLKIIFARRIIDDNGIPCNCHGEAFPNGRQIAFAMEAPSMKAWQRIFGPIGAIILTAAHEMTHIAQIRKGDPPSNSAELIKNKGITAYSENPREIEAHIEAFDLLKALRPHEKVSVQIGGRNYTSPNKSTYDINLSRLPDYIT